VNAPPAAAQARLDELCRVLGSHSSDEGSTGPKPTSVPSAPCSSTPEVEELLWRAMLDLQGLAWLGFDWRALPGRDDPEAVSARVGLRLLLRVAQYVMDLVTMVAGGLATSGHTLVCALRLLASHPDIQADLAVSITTEGPTSRLLDRVVAEATRLYPSALLGPIRSLLAALPDKEVETGEDAKAFGLHSTSLQSGPTCVCATGGMTVPVAFVCIAPAAAVAPQCSSTADPAFTPPAR